MTALCLNCSFRAPVQCSILYSTTQPLFTTGWFMKNVIPSGIWFVMSCWWKKFIWIWVRFLIVSEKTTYIFRNSMNPCEQRSVDLHSAWDKRAISWYWGMTFLTGNITAWLSGLPNTCRSSLESSSRLFLTLCDLRTFGLLPEILTSEFWVDNKLYHLLSLLLFSQRFINCYIPYIRHGSCQVMPFNTNLKESNNTLPSSVSF